MRFIVHRATCGSEPVSSLMIGMGCVALIANVICLAIIRKQKNGEVHMRASWIFSANDVIANMGVILAGGMVYLFDTRWPDLVIGFIVSIVVMRGAVLILKDARRYQGDKTIVYLGDYIDRGEQSPGRS